MTYKEGIEHKIACMQAHLRGERVECRARGEWSPVPPQVNFVLSGKYYRIAPKPQPKIPSGVFWVRSSIGPAHLVTEVRDSSMVFGPRFLDLEWAVSNGWQWSHDRVTWHSFTEVQP